MNPRLQCLTKGAHGGPHPARRFFVPAVLVGAGWRRSVRVRRDTRGHAKRRGL